jgi:hypothetical protein
MLPSINKLEKDKTLDDAENANLKKVIEAMKDIHADAEEKKNQKAAEKEGNK